MELKDTVELMNSKDYKERFVAEYLQTKIRYEKLKYMIKKWDKGELSFTPDCPRRLYAIQLKSMADYLIALEVRATIEKIELPKFEGVKEKEEEKTEGKKEKKELSKEEKEKLEETVADLLLLSFISSLLK